MARQYEFRPAKAAQRRMIVDACRRLTAISALDQYQYVGFGGLEFIDFIEFHRGLGIPRMTSIERDTNMQHRLEFNKPYKGIRVLMGEARDQLPQVDWTIPAITWLDYTDVLTKDILRDLDYVVRSSVPGSIVIVTVNGAATFPLSSRLDNLREKLGDLIGDGLARRQQHEWLGTRAGGTERAASHRSLGEPRRPRSAISSTLQLPLCGRRQDAHLGRDYHQYEPGPHDRCLSIRRPRLRSHRKRGI